MGNVASTLKTMSRAKRRLTFARHLLGARHFTNPVRQVLAPFAPSANRGAEKLRQLAQDHTNNKQ